MPTETEYFTDEEYLVDFDTNTEHTPSAEYEQLREAIDEHQEDTEIETAEGQETDPTQEALLEQKGGEADDWELVDQGGSGFRFDGQEIRDPEGNVWVNEDQGLHQAMLSQWKEGGSGVFFLPDYREVTADGEILYTTQLILGEKGDVSYRIDKYETIRPKDEEQGSEVAERPAEHATSLPDAETLAEVNDTESSATPDTWLAELLQNDLLERPSDAESVPHHAAEELTPTPRETETILYTHAMPVSTTRGLQNPEHSMPSGGAGTQLSWVSPLRHDHIEPAPRNTARSRMSKDGIILEMAV